MPPKPNMISRLIGEFKKGLLMQCTLLLGHILQFICFFDYFSSGGGGVPGGGGEAPLPPGTDGLDGTKFVF